MDIWTASDNQIRQIAKRKVASAILSLNLTVSYIVKTSGLFATVRVYAHDVRRFYDVTVYARELR